MLVHLLEARVLLASLPAGFQETRVAGGLNSPVAMDVAPDGRVFVAQQNGQVRVIRNGTLLSTPLVTVPASDAERAQGLIGITIDPAFASNGYVYLNFSTRSREGSNEPGGELHQRISRFTVSGDLAPLSSERIVFDLDPQAPNGHVAGALDFGRDGKLYIAYGDNFQPATAASMSNFRGKMLRINPDGSIPTDNPFYSTASGKYRAIYAKGLRNPFTFAVQPGTGRTFVNDVGEALWEEVNELAAGADYGWPAIDGPRTTQTPPRNYRDPFIAYGHGTGSDRGCSVAGGAFYNPPVVQFPAAYVGDYFYADFCNNWIRRVTDPGSGSASEVFATGLLNPIDLDVAPDGSLYYLGRGSDAFGDGLLTGVVHRIRYTGASAPTIAAQPADLTVSQGQAAVFRVEASGAAPLSYQWQRNGADVPGATRATFELTSPTLADNGATFRAVVRNASGSVTSRAARLTVTANRLPSATIASPAAGTLYAGGETFSFSGSASDPEDGVLAAGAFAWRVDFHHDQHSHPFLGPITGTRSGSFTIPTSGETSTNVWYRVTLTVRDRAGATHTTYRDLRPRTATFTLTTNVTGLRLDLDGQPKSTPAAVPAVAGMTRTLAAPAAQTLNGAMYEFVSWSDGGARIHTITTPRAAATYTATYRAGTARVVGLVFDDRDGDGARDAGEPGLRGRRVFIDADGDGAYDGGERSAQTDAAGNYALTGLAAGTYRVRQVLPSGWRVASPSSGHFDLTLASGQSAASRNFATTRTAVVSGAVYDDADRDGARDAGERGLAGWRVFVDADNDGVLDAGERSVLTDSAGNYRFTLAAGNYALRVVRQPGWVHTAPSSGAHVVNPAAGGVLTNSRFGFRR